MRHQAFGKAAAATLLMLLMPLLAQAQRTDSYTSTHFDHHIFDHTTFYDGYRLTNFPDSIETGDDILRHTTYCYAVRLSDFVLQHIGDSVRLKVGVTACCDNYDRIGNVNLALVPKGSDTYNVDSVPRIELGRFITPFMNKNAEPNTVPYEFDVSYLSHILRDRLLLDTCDLWMEMEIFGVPYAAQTQISGCENRSDVFQGTLYLETQFKGLPQTDKNVLVPIAMKAPEWKGSGHLNNYNEANTDTLGKTTKTYYYTVPRDVADAQLVIVTSNHGANTDGEEYNRRWHYVYVDDELLLTYMPGRNSCEPFRKYNTQSNGIYGTSAKTDTEWQSFSNWCPGDVIDNRIIRLGAVKAGSHKVRISVPDAVFKDSVGYIPVSIFFQGLTEGQLAGISSAHTTPLVGVQLQGGTLSFANKDDVAYVEIRDVQGRRLYRSITPDSVSLTAYPKGVYLVNVETADGIVETHKILNK